MTQQSNTADVPVLRSEKNIISKETAKKGKVIGVFTSGGDSQGMNAAVRAVVRMGIHSGCRVFFIKEGYQGMVTGGHHIIEASWGSVSGIIQKGGTVIGSARCKEFRQPSGRLKAAMNLIEHQITNLVVIGGDGSLTGANLFRQEWTSLLNELVNKGKITKEKRETCSDLHIVGMVGSIDNDFCGTDMTIGTDSALHRIIEAIDAIVTTAISHQRTFILEVMGRHCGYLALVAALASETDFLFVPEWPPETDWPQLLCQKLQQTRQMGQRLNVIIVCEGAVDREGNPITSEQVKKEVIERTGQDTRITVLGHVQRGGRPSAFDRILGCRMGEVAVSTLLADVPGSESCVVTLDGNKIIRVPLMRCVEKTQSVTTAMRNKRWDEAVELRGRSFQRNIEAYKLLTRITAPNSGLSSGYRLAVMHIGSPCCGMNGAVHSFVRNVIFTGNTVLGIRKGIDGLISDTIEHRLLGWAEVNNWVCEGGAFLGARRTLPGSEIRKIAEKIIELKINGLLVIGGFEAFQTVLQLAESRNEFTEFRIPMCVIPASISNNIPGTDFSLGTDTALNQITEMCDTLRQTSQGTVRRVFVVETMGGFCGYLATLAGLATGADAVYIHEEKFTVKDMLVDINNIRSKMAQGVKRGLVFMSENANINYTTDFVFRLYSEEGKDMFTTRKSVLGHIQKGGSPSPFDRNFGNKMAAKAAQWLIHKMTANIQNDSSYCSTPDTAILLGLVEKDYKYTPVQELKAETDFTNRIPTNQWWFGLRKLLQSLSTPLDYDSGVTPTNYN